MMTSLKPGGRILVVKLSSLGDLFHALPVVHLLRSRLHLTIDWVTQPEYVDLVGCFDDVNEVYAFPRRQLLSGWKAYRKAFSQRYDAVLDLQGLMKSVLAARGAGSRPVLGPWFSRDGARWLYDQRIGHPAGPRHAVDVLLDFASAAGLNWTPQEVRFPVTFPSSGRSFSGTSIAWVPRSRWASKNWSLSRVEATCRILLEMHPELNFYMIGGPEDREAGEELERKTPSFRNLAGELSLLESGGALAAMDAVVSVDSGPMHMAAASGAPVIALFGVTDPSRTGPYGPQHRILMSPTFGDPSCLARTFKKAPPEAWDIDPETVADAVESVLNP